MRTKVHFLTFDEVFSTLRTLGFDVQGVPGVANQFLVSKYGAGAVLAKAGEPSEAEKKLPHTVCKKCGEYKGRAVVAVKSAE